MSADIQIAEQTGEIVQLLSDNAGKFYNITEMAKRFKVNRSAMGLALASLAHSGRIRASMATNRAQAYYMPTQAQLEAEARRSRCMDMVISWNTEIKNITFKDASAVKRETGNTPVCQ